MPTQPTDVPGMVEAGNIDWSARPIIVNDDGSVSSVRSISFQDDQGNEVLIPTISPDGKVLTPQEAIALYRVSGQHLGKFKTPDAADAFALKYHAEMAPNLQQSDPLTNLARMTLEREKRRKGQSIAEQK